MFGGVYVACQGFIRLLVSRKNHLLSIYFQKWIIGEFDKNYNLSLIRLICQQHDKRI